MSGHRHRPPAAHVRRGAGAGDESAYVHRLADRLAQQHVKAEWDVAHDRDAAGAVARFAATRPSSLVALTTHGRGRLSRLALGSVALDVARRATVPVLVVRPQVPTRDSPA